VSRSRASGRLRLTLLVLALAVVAYAVVRGPYLFERFSHPLDHQQAIADAAAASHLDPYLVAAVINAESGFRDDAVSGAGAVGLMQILPSTAQAVAARIGLKGRMDAAALKNPETNIRIGCDYLAELVDRYDGNVDLALAAYNAGISNADQWAVRWRSTKGAVSAVIDFPETARYVEEVAAQMTAYREVYPDAFPAARK
jgi:soluble lytic murein transglycosylase